MIKQIGSIIFVAFIFSGCVQQNAFKTYYKPFNNQEHVAKVENNQDVDVKGFFNYDAIENDRKTMSENGWISIGVSSFYGGDNFGKLEDVAAVAKENNATKVIAYQKSLGQVNAGSVSTYVGYGVSINQPVIVNKMEYLADYYKKAKPSICGCRVDNLTTQQKQSIGTNKGVVIKSLIINSAGYNADLLEGDIIQKVDDSVIGRLEDFTNTIKQNNGKEVVFTIYRNSQLLTKNVKLNKVD